MRKGLLNIFLFLCINLNLQAFCIPDTICTENAIANEKATVSVLDKELNKLLQDPLFERSQVGIYIYDLTDNQVLFTHNENQCMRPASNEKVITAISALHFLGTDYQYRTELYCDENDINKNHNETCHIYIKGGYDPLFCEEDMTAFTDSIKAKGFNNIKSIYLDKSFKDSKQWGWGWCWDDDEIPLTPLLYDNKDRFKERCTAILRRNGFNWYGEFKCKKTPNKAKLLCTRKHTIDQVLLPTMKESDNSMAESIFYQIAALNNNHPGTRKMAVEKIEKLIRYIGLNPHDYQIADGSGLSLYNYLSPKLLGRFLQFAYNNNKIYTHLLPSLPIAGEDGSLKRRMLGTKAAGNVQAKTGTVEGVSTLSGYCTTANGHRLCFSIMNQGIRKTKNGRNFQDKVCAILCR